MITIGLYGIPDTSLHGDIPVYTHDHSTTLMDDGSVIEHATLERITGLKHDNSLPYHFTKIFEDGLKDIPTMSV